MLSGVCSRGFFTRGNLQLTNRRRMRRENRIQEMVEPVRSTQRGRNSNPSTYKRKHRQNDQWEDHDHWALVRSAVPVVSMCIVTVVSVLRICRRSPRYSPKNVINHSRNM